MNSYKRGIVRSTGSLYQGINLVSPRDGYPEGNVMRHRARESGIAIRPQEAARGSVSRKEARSTEAAHIPDPSITSLQENQEWET